MPKMTLIQYPGLTPRTTLSPPCGKVLMTLRFKGLEYEIKNVTGPQQIPKYNKRGRVPVLLVDDEVLVDSTDIVTALDARYPEPPLMPADRLDAARVRILEDWADEVLYFYGVYMRWCVEGNFRRMQTEVLSRLPIPVRWIAPIMAKRQLRHRTAGQGVGLKDDATVRREFKECFESIVALLTGQPFLVGENLTRADIAVAAVIDQQNLPRLTPQVAHEIQSHPEIMNWLDRVHHRAPNAAME